MEPWVESGSQCSVMPSKDVGSRWLDLIGVGFQRSGGPLPLFVRTAHAYQLTLIRTMHHLNFRSHTTILNPSTMLIGVPASSRSNRVWEHISDPLLL